MLVRAYSDLHGFLPVIEPCDLLLIAGDISPIDGEYGDHEPKTQDRWLKDVFNPWCDQLPVEQIVLIGGNHDAILDPNEARGYAWSLNGKVTYLLDSSVQIENGPSIFGSPWIPNLAMWPFYRPDFKLRELAEQIPDGHDIWLFHSPPALFESWFQLDLTVRGEHVGNAPLTPVIRERGPQIFICGHIHEGFGVATDAIGSTNLANCAYVDHKYRPRSRHIEVEWDEDDHSVTRVESVTSPTPDEMWWDWKEHH